MELRTGEKGARNDSGEGNFAHRCPRVPDSQENDLGDEKPSGSPILGRQSCSGETAEGVNRMAGIPCLSDIQRQFTSTRATSRQTHGQHKQRR